MMMEFRVVSLSTVSHSYTAQVRVAAHFSMTSSLGTIIPRRGAPTLQHPEPAGSPEAVCTFKPPPHRTLALTTPAVTAAGNRASGPGAVRGDAMSPPRPPCDERCRVTPGQWLPRLRQRHRQGARPSAEAERCRHSRVPRPRARCSSALWSPYRSTAVADLYWDGGGRGAVGNMATLVLDNGAYNAKIGYSHANVR